MEKDIVENASDAKGRHSTTSNTAKQIQNRTEPAKCDEVNVELLLKQSLDKPKELNWNSGKLEDKCSKHGELLTLRFIVLSITKTYDKPSRQISRTTPMDVNSRLDKFCAR